MNKSVLVGAGLFSLLCSPLFAQDTVPSVPQITTPNSTTQTKQPTTLQDGTSNTQNQAPSTTPSTSTTPNNGTSPGASTSPSTPADSSTSPAVPATPADTSTPSDTTTPSSTGTSGEAATPTPTTGTLNCSFHIPAETTTVDTNLVMQWAEKAAQQTFALDPNIIDSQLTALKSCYTDQGWKSFNDALTKSGNLNAIKKENLTVSSVLDGLSTVTSMKDNQWKVTVPLQVVYQNGKEKILQALTINLIVTRKTSGDLGVMQVVAMPRQSATNPAANTAPAESTPATNAPAEGTSPGASTTTPAAQ